MELTRNCKTIALKSEEKGKYSNIKNHNVHHIVLHKVGPYGGPRFPWNKFFIESSNKLIFYPLKNA
jgi:hypothetical protein